MACRKGHGGDETKPVAASGCVVACARCGETCQAHYWDGRLTTGPSPCWWIDPDPARAWRDGWLRGLNCAESMINNALENILDSRWEPDREGYAVRLAAPGALDRESP